MIVGGYILCMVKKENRRVMLTLTPKSLSYLDKLMELYDMTASQVVKLLLNKEVQERRIG